MIRVLIHLAALPLWVTGQSPSSKVHQTPIAILKGSKDNVQLTCNHTIQNYNTILWYQQSTGDTAMKLIGYAFTKSITMEKSFEKHFNVSGDGVKEAYLHLVSLRAPEDSAMYYCAADTGASFSEAYFGAGTKLTVLEPDILVTQPTVKVLPPSTKECEDRNKKKKKTLVCVATDFYPDHVTVFWQLNGGAQITDGVGTDNTALRDENRSYSITSRLRVPAKKWNKSSNRFTCTVRFFNGTHNIDVADHINGEGGDDGEMTTESYVRSTQTAKLAYSIFIAKSTFYGLVVMVLIWKVHRSSDKQM